MDKSKDIIILPCTAKKVKLENFFGKTFIANPSCSEETRPFDRCGIDGFDTWYDAVEGYQDKNCNALTEAYRLYQPKGDQDLYKEVYKEFGDRFMIFSAGWGLIKASYKLPYYDITFNGSSKNANHRKNKDGYRDLNQLPEIVNKYPNAKIYSVLLGQYPRNLIRLLGKEIEITPLDASKLGGNRYTQVYRYVRSEILK